MNFLKKLFQPQQKKENSTYYTGFWDWFVTKEKKFHKVVKERNNVELALFDKLSAQLDQLHSGFYFLAGMFDEETAELVFTADGDLKNIVFIEALVAAAPELNGWRFTALKPPSKSLGIGIEMSDYKFDKDTISFYSNDHPEHPDAIDITFVHQDYRADNEPIISNGTFIFLDNFLGELNFATLIDNMDLVAPQDAREKLIPIEKLNNFLIWRQKEFIEKYDGFRHHTEEDEYAMLEGVLENGNSLIITINNELLHWDSKASHPWILRLEFFYDGEDNNGMPHKEMYDFLNELEEELIDVLPSRDGYLNVGRQTGDNVRTLFLACKEFRKPSLACFKLQQKYGSEVTMEYTIYKDKYWISFNHFVKH
jgi:hypothetical protein